MTSLGVDIIEIERIKAAAERTGSFLEKTFTKDELDYSFKKKNKYESLAGFFAAKEAYAKFLGTGLRGIKLNEIAVMHDELGAPYIRYMGKKTKTKLTISHNKTTAIAVVYGENQGICTEASDLEMRELFPVRRADSNKGDFGRVAVVAGSRGMTGAAVLSAYSALRSGSGLVTLVTAASQQQVAAGFYPEIMTCGVADLGGVICADDADKIISIAQDSDAVVFGPGLGKGPHILDVLKRILKEYSGTLLIDADGLNALSRETSILNDAKGRIILTPHPGEMSRLTGVEVSQIQSGRVRIAEDFAKTYGVCVVLKGHGTVVAMEGFETYVNNTGNPGMATAGTGDVLSGIIGSLAGQGIPPFDAAKLGVYIHGMAGDFARFDKGEFGLVAGDVAQQIPYAIRHILGEI